MIDPMTIPPSSPGSEATAGPKLPSAVCFKGPQTKSRMPGWPLPASQCLPRPRPLFLVDHDC